MFDLEACLDDTLPPDHIKFLHGDDQASVFRLDLETETSELVARCSGLGHNCSGREIQ